MTSENWLFFKFDYLALADKKYWLGKKVSNCGNYYAPYGFLVGLKKVNDHNCHVSSGITSKKASKKEVAIKLINVDAGDIFKKEYPALWNSHSS